MTRALLWLQWRLLVNGVRHRGRDTLERTSRIAQLALPVVVVALLVPLVLVLAVLAVVAGWQIAEPSTDRTALILVVGLPVAIPFLWVLVRPFVPAEHVQLTRGELLRLLPISPRLLQSLDLLAVLVDPFVLPFAVAVLALPLGCLAAGRPLLALGSLAAGVVFLAVTASVGVLAMVVVQLFLRDRRRAEAAALLFFLVASVGGLLPQAFVRHEPTARRALPAAGFHRTAGGVVPAGERIPGVLAVIPPMALPIAITALSSGSVGEAAAPVAIMLVLGLASYLLAVRVDRRLRETPAHGSSGGAAPSRRAALRLPFVAPGTAAVAWVHIRAFLRTTRGRMALVGPPLIVLVLGMAASEGGRGPIAWFRAPLALAAFGLWGCLSNLATTVATNQFAVAGSGLLLELLQPLDDAVLLRGRCIGQATVLAIQILLVLGPLGLLFPSIGPLVLLALFLGTLAVYFLASPLFALLSALAPKTADLSRIGRAGNTSVVASFVTLPAIPLAAAPVAALGWIALGELQRPWLFPLLAATWLACTVGFAWALSSALAALVRSRRENLALVAAGR